MASKAPAAKQQPTTLGSPVAGTPSSAAGPLSLTIVNTPNNNLVHTNFAYVSQQQFGGRPTYVKVKDCVFIAQPHQQIENGCIALNKLQRNSAHVSTDVQQQCEIFQVPKHNFVLSSITLEMDFVAPGMAQLGRDVDAKALLDRVSQMYSNQIFSEGQKLVIESEGTMLLATIQNLEVLETESLVSLDGGNGNAKSEFKLLPSMGQLVTSTKVVLTKPKNSALQFKNLETVSTSINAAPLINADFSFEKLGIGGLDQQLGRVFRRAVASRVYPPEVINKLGITHVKGIMLYGPPGTGKTLMARQIGKMLNAVEPKVVNGPEILNKYVGQSEENIRNLFAEAEAEYEEKGDASQLHLLIFDEIDAICKSRGTVGGGTGVNDSVVNQLLSKIDGVKSLNNVLVIGMTNRLDLIDEALLRPGRFEVQVEIGLPDEAGRLQILNIHTSSMRKNNMMATDVNLAEIAGRTKNFSGAELSGVVRDATSYALNRHVDMEKLGKQGADSKNIKVCMADFDRALEEIKPAFGIKQDELENFMQQGIIEYGPRFARLLATCRSFVNQVRTSKSTNILSVLLSGENGTGKTTLAAHLAVQSGFPFVKIISPETMVGYSESAKCGAITKMFNDAYKSNMSIIVLDNIERLIEYVHLGSRFSNGVLQTLLVLLKKAPPHGRKLLIFGTTSLGHILKNMEIMDGFNIELDVPTLTDRSDIRTVLIETGAFAKDDASLDNAVTITPPSIAIKKLQLVVEVARSRVSEETGEDVQQITYEAYLQSLKDCGAMGFKDEDLDESI